MRKWQALGIIATTVALALTAQACGSSGGTAGNTTQSGTSSGSPASNTGEAPASKGTLTLAWRDGITSWDPAQAHISDFMDIYQTSYDTLLLRRPTAG